MDTSSAWERAWVHGRRRVRPLILAVCLVGALAAIPVPVGSGAGPAITAAGGAGGYYWAPAQAETTPGGSVEFRSSNPTIPHGVSWTGGPGTPVCSGVPIDDFKTEWSGSCAFAQAGTYPFVCTVHPTEMKGTVTVGAGSSEGPGPNPPGGASGPLASGLKLAKRQRGGSLRGSIEVADDGGKLTIELRAARALLGSGGSGKARVGRIVRGGVSGHVTFVVPLTKGARSALADRRTLPLTAAVSVAGQGDDAFRRTRGVVMVAGNR